MPCGCCLIAAVGSVIPRLTILFLWIVTDLVDRAIEQWWLTVLGIIFLPFTTLFYVLMYAPVQGVTGFGWVVVVLAFLADIGNYGGGAFGRGKSIG